MRLLVWLLALGLTWGCGNKVEHPDLAPACDPAVMECGVKPPMSGQPGGGNEAGAGSSDPEGATVSGDVRLFSDDSFAQGVGFSGPAEVSAVGESGARVEGDYDGTSFELERVLKDATNWFLVEPEASSGALPTITAVDTRVVVAGDLRVGLVSDLTIDGMFALLAAERATNRAQVVVRVVDEQGRSVAGVLGGLTAEVAAYREAGGWIASDVGTDDSGLIFFGNVPATPSLAMTNITFSGAVSARVEALTRAGATTVVTAVVSPP